MDEVANVPRGVYNLKLNKPFNFLGAGIIGSGMGCVDGVATWCLYKLSGETVSQRWLRELREIQIANSLKDKDQHDQTT